jgi:arylsulfatase A-like enzyme
LAGPHEAEAAPNLGGRNMSKHSRRAFLKTAAFGSAAVGINHILSGCKTNTTKPNVILIMVDDMGYECLSCNGSASYQTPFLDELARTGVRFNHCYSQPLCTPSRVQIMTGKYNHRNYTEFGQLRPGETTFGHLLQQAGYRTCVAGKWQLAGRIQGSAYKGTGSQPEDAGFDEHCLWQVNRRESRFWDPVIQTNGQVRDDLDGLYGPDIFCEFINDFVDRNRDQPFFVYFPMVLTHSPFVPTPASTGQADRHKNDDRFFADMVSYTDELVKRIVNNLDRLNLREKTLILFTTDNGTHKRIKSRMKDGSEVQGGKGETTLAGMHVPLIASWKGVNPEGEVCDDLIDFSDFLPTLLEVTDTPAGDFVLDGRSFSPQLKGKPGTPREWIYCYYQPKWGSWRDVKRFAGDKRWKLYDDGALYDFQDDPLEQHPVDLAALPQNVTAIKDKLQTVLDKMDR